MLNGVKDLIKPVGGGQSWQIDASLSLSMTSHFGC